MYAIRSYYAVSRYALLRHEFFGERRASEQDGNGKPRLPVLGHAFLHDDGGLDEEAGKADRVDSVFPGFPDDRLRGDLDAEVDHAVPVVGEDDVDQVLSDVVDVPGDGRQKDLPAGVPVGPGQKGLVV